MASPGGGGGGTGDATGDEVETTPSQQQQVRKIKLWSAQRGGRLCAADGGRGRQR